MFRLALLQSPYIDFFFSLQCPFPIAHPQCICYLRLIVPLTDLLHFSFTCLSSPAHVFLRSYRNVNFQFRRSSLAYFGGMCSLSRGVGVNEVILRVKQHCRKITSDLCCFLFLQYGNSLAMAGSLSQSLAQNLGIQWDPASKKSTHEAHTRVFF